MSETAPEAQATPDGNEGGETSTATSQFEPITSQEAFDKALSKRLERERAKFADYDDLKAKAGQLDALSAASETEQDKLNRRIAELEDKSAKAEIAALRSKYAADVPEKQRALLTGTTDEELAAQRDLILEGISDRKKQGNHVPSEGNNTRPDGEDDARFARALFAPSGD